MNILPKVMYYFRENIYFILGLLVTALVILGSDGRVLLGNTPQLYGLIDVPWSVLEETALYTPYISNFDVIEPLRIDYSGPFDDSALAPYPYIAIAIMGAAKYLSGGDVSVALFLLHALIVAKYLIIFWML